MNIEEIKDTRPFCVPDTLFYISKVRDDNPKSMTRCHYHNTYEIYYLRSGERFYFIKDKMYHIKKGDLVIIPPDEIHATLNAGDNGYERCLISFDRAYIETYTKAFEHINFFECFEGDTRCLSLDTKKQFMFEEAFEELCSQEQTGGSECSKFLVMQVLMLINNESGGKKEADGKELSQATRIVSQVMGYISNNYSGEITLSETAGKFYVSLYYLSRTFKKVCGISFVDYVNNVRVKEAKKLLTETKFSIQKVGEEVGFKSNTHFGRIFKEICGMSPIKYKKMIG